MNFMALKSRENVLNFEIDSYLNDSAFSAVKRDTKFKKGFFFDWLLAVMKSFAWFVCRVYATDKPSANDSANAKSHARDKPLLTG